MKDQEGGYPASGQVSSSAEQPGSKSAPVTWWDDEYRNLFEIQNRHRRDPRRPRRLGSRSRILNGKYVPWPGDSDQTVPIEAAVNGQTSNKVEFTVTRA